MRIFDTSFNAVLSNNGEELFGNHTDKINYSGSEAYFRGTGDVRTDKLRAYNDIYQFLSRQNLYSNMRCLYPISQRSPEAAIIEFKTGGAGLTASGDYGFSRTGITGSGSVYFDTGQNASTRISDINNFSFGVFIYDDSDGGYDFACNDTTNYVAFSAKTGGAVDVKIGTATDNFTTAQGVSNGNWIVNVRGGNFYTYWEGIEVGTTTAVAGSLPNQNIYLGGSNNNGTGGDYASRTYGFMWLYNGAMTEEQVQNFDLLIRSQQYLQSRDYGLS